MILFIVPKNSGLSFCKKLAERKFQNKEIKSVRGEDVPSFIKEFSKKGKGVIGITGEDLFKEFSLKNSDKNIEIIEKIPWDDENACFGKPSLCLLVPRGKKLKQLQNNLKVCINKKYVRIAEKFLSELKQRENKTFEKIYLSGETEAAFENNLCDLVIDVVYSGKSAREAGLDIYEKIFCSDIVVIRSKNNFNGNRCFNNRGFDLRKLYEIVLRKINSSDEKSYTKKLANNTDLLKRKIVEEVGETITSDQKQDVIWECSDLIYFLLVFMAKKEVGIEDLEKELERRNFSKNKSKGTKITREKLLNEDKLNKLTKKDQNDKRNS